MTASVHEHPHLPHAQRRPIAAPPHALNTGSRRRRPSGAKFQLYAGALAACSLALGVAALCAGPHGLQRALAIPAPIFLALSLVATVSLVCTGQWCVHRAFQRQDFVRHNEVAGVIFPVVGSMYAVVLGFMTVVAWQHYSDARQIVSLES
ncbi:MAG TPA: hypothetical protein VKG44_10575, partial [Candidatus Baltobacteraceae bacterium]|nr:hypothetical protein [Candidatus Baltobacteraceae bacterium]